MTQPALGTQRQPGLDVLAKLQPGPAVAPRRFPPSDPDFQRPYRRRNDAESINRALDDTLFLRRAHSIGQERQHLNLLTYALP